jgi:hypothetical protein
MLDVIDEAASEWICRKRPVLGDLTAEPEVERFLRGLEERCLPFAMKVGDQPSGHDRSPSDWDGNFRSGHRRRDPAWCDGHEWLVYRAEADEPDLSFTRVA